MRAYHSYLSTAEAANSPFGTTVILHNLVTATIPDEFQRKLRPRFFCVKHAAAQISAELLPEDFSPRVPVLPDGVELPGVGHHRLVDC